MMGKALPLRSDLSADALRAQARQEKKGRVVARMLAIAHALDGVGRAQADGWLAWTAKRCATR